MGTRSITTIRSRWEKRDWQTHAVIYRHWDGYLGGHGAFLSDFLTGRYVTNGKAADPMSANGPGRLAAQLVAAMQDAGVDPDLLPTVSDVGQEYHYQIDVQFGGPAKREFPITITVFDGPMTAFGCGGDECTREIFSGTPEAFAAFVQQPKTV
jgi:hypothetical protein